MRSISSYVDVLKEQDRPVRFVIARFLGKTGLCRFFRIRCRDYSMHFFPTAMSSALWVDPDYRREDVEFMEAYLRPGDTVIDAGANVGFLTLLAARLVGAAGRVFAIEAHPRTAAYLARNLRLNRVEHVEVLAVGVGDESGSIVFSDSELDDQNRVSPDGEGVRVPVATLDELFALRVSEVHLLKLDVEGYELPALAGAGVLLQRVHCIFLESFDENCRRYGRTVGDVIALLYAAGFTVFRRDGDALLVTGADHASPVCENLVAARDPAALEFRLAGSGLHVVRAAAA